jgi:hypothetical protein
MTSNSHVLPAIVPHPNRFFQGQIFCSAFEHDMELPQQKEMGENREIGERRHLSLA